MQLSGSVCCGGRRSVHVRAEKSEDNPGFCLWVEELRGSGATLGHPCGFPWGLVWMWCRELESPTLCWQVISKKSNWKCSPGTPVLLETQPPAPGGTLAEHRGHRQRVRAGWGPRERPRASAATCSQGQGCQPSWNSACEDSTAWGQ